MIIEQNSQYMNINYHKFYDKMQKKYVLISLLTFFGAINLVIKKVQNIQVIDRQTGQKFYHPYLHTTLFFIGQSIAGIYYLLFFRKKSYDDYHSIKQISKRKPIAPHHLVIIPTIFQMGNVIFLNFALNLVDTSILQISRGGTVVATALLSKIFLHKKFTSRSIFGCMLAFIGITGVQTASVYFANKKSHELAQSQTIGYGFLLLSVLSNSIGLTLEKRLFDKYQMHSIKFISLQGIYGLIFTILLTYFISYFPCPWANISQCVCLSINQCYLDNFNKFLSGLFSSNLMIGITLIYIFLTSFVSSIAITLLKQVSAVSRALGNVNRTLFIWIFSSIITLTIGAQSHQYRFQNLSLQSNLSKIVGFTILLIGIVLYHDGHNVHQASKDKLKAK